MIIPCPVDFWNYAKYPLTWAIIITNLLMFMIFFLDGKDSINWVTFFSEQNMTTTGRVYEQYLKELPEEKKAQLPAWVSTLKIQNTEHYQTFGSWALRDYAFLNQAEKIEVIGDVVALAHWREGIKQFRESYFDQLVFRLGLSQVNKNSLSWITYQFSHSGFLHLISNMIYFLIIGAAVEAMVGSVGLIVLYLLGGIFAGLFFLMIKSHGGAIPVVGASGSISALISFYVVFEQRTRIRYAYFVSLLPKHHGYIYLPTLWMFPLFIISDFAHHLSSVEGLGSGVAYTAHIGGTLFGVVAALILRFGFSMKNNLLHGEIFQSEEAVLIKPGSSNIF